MSKKVNQNLLTMLGVAAGGITLGYLANSLLNSNRQVDNDDDDINDNSNESSGTPTLYIHPLSEVSRAVWHFALVADIELDIQKVDLENNEHKKQEYTNINPFQKVPALKDGNFSFGESCAISRYLAKINNQMDEWFGKNLKQRTKVDEYLHWHHNNLRQSSIAWEHYVLYPLLKLDVDEHEKQNGLKKLQESLDAIENIWLKDNNTYLCGNSLTIADLFAAHQICQHTFCSGFYPVKIGERTKKWLNLIKETQHFDVVTEDLMQFGNDNQIQKLKELAQLCQKYSIKDLNQLKLFQKGILNKDSLLRPVVVSGPSGVGKSTLIKLLRKQFPEKFGFSVSHTTREKRKGEIDGIDYHFVSVKDFEVLINENAFIEHAEYAGNHYGTSYATVRIAKQKQLICLLDIDLQGIKIIKKNWDENKNGLMPAFIQVIPPSFKDLEKRLSARGDTSQEAIQKRLETARDELTYTLKPGFFDAIVINDDKELAAEKLALAINETQIPKQK